MRNVYLEEYISITHSEPMSSSIKITLRQIGV